MRRKIPYGKVTIVKCVARRWNIYCVVWKISTMHLNSIFMKRMQSEKFTNLVVLRRKQNSNNKKVHTQRNKFEDYMKIAISTECFECFFLFFFASNCHGDNGFAWYPCNLQETMAFAKVYYYYENWNTIWCIEHQIRTCELYLIKKNPNVIGKKKFHHHY